MLSEQITRHALYEVCCYLCCDPVFVFSCLCSVIFNVSFYYCLFYKCLFGPHENEISRLIYRDRINVMSYKSSYFD